MKQIDEIITLDTNSNNERMIFNAKYLVEDYFTILVSVISNDFAGKSDFCFKRMDIASFSEELASMHNTLVGNALIRDSDSDGFIEISIEITGKLKVSGQIGGSHQEQYMRFNFFTDQTALPNFISRLNAICSYQN